MATVTHVAITIGAGHRSACDAETAAPARFTEDVREADCEACRVRLARSPQLVNALVAHLRAHGRDELARALLELPR